LGVKVINEAELRELAARRETGESQLEIETTNA
jgi:hypothetical protein